MTATKEITINAEQELYVIPCGDGYSCLGFDVLIERTNATLDWLAKVIDVPSMAVIKITPAERGTLEAYAKYNRVMELGALTHKETGKRCPCELTPQLAGLEGKRVEVVDKYGEKRRFYVGKSTGWMPCHLEIKTRSSSGGGAVTGAPFKSVRVVGQR